MKQDWDIYTSLLRHYFPCEKPSQETITPEKKEMDELEADVLNKDNIPDSNLGDLVDMIEKEKQVTASAGKMFDK